MYSVKENKKNELIIKKSKFITYIYQIHHKEDINNILDALKSVGIPAIEVHISDVDSREEFRKISYITSYCIERIAGMGFAGYLKAVDDLFKFVSGK